jgi:hypothetical protein
MTGMLKDQRGSGLIVLLGIVAALVVMSLTLVTLTANVQSNTADDRTRAKSFHVTEAAVDAGMHMLSEDWPLTSDAATQPVFDESAFAALFPEDEFPRPAGDFVEVVYYDNQTPVDESVTWDESGPSGTPDGKMWLTAQASVGTRSSRIIALVEVSYWRIGLPRGIALWAGGNLTSNGSGNNPKIQVEVPPPVGTTTSVHVGGTIEESDVTQSGIAQLTGENAADLEDVFPQSLVDTLVKIAAENDREFDSLLEAEASPVDYYWSPTGGLSGLTVINTSPGETVKITANTQLNSVEKPGILMIMGGGTFDWGGTADFFGVIYCEGPMNTSHGTADIHGMVVTKSHEDLRGTPNVLYNDDCISRLDRRFPSTVRMVPNTWRELKPE